MNDLPLIFDIQRTSFEDGTGIRTIVFFKGCPLRCSWCHNPESQSLKREILWHAGRCRNCNACAAACRHNAIRSNPEEEKIDRVNCIMCGECSHACDYNAMQVAGIEYSAEALAEIILRDKTYYKISGGGVTFSGGEPLIFMEYLTMVSRKLKGENVDIAVQTCGHFNFDQFEATISPFISTIYFDLKLAGEKLHTRFTGSSNELILQNLARLFSPKKHRIIIRTPLIPGITNTPDNLLRIRQIIEPFDFDGYEELIFNDSYGHKLAALGRATARNHES
ncbi:MAG: glycyl-radical enzyme activating protein [Bacteroidota bacterium]